MRPTWKNHLNRCNVKCTNSALEQNTLQSKDIKYLWKFVAKYWHKIAHLNYKYFQFDPPQLIQTNFIQPYSIWDKNVRSSDQLFLDLLTNLLFKISLHQQNERNQLLFSLITQVQHILFKMLPNMACCPFVNSLLPMLMTKIRKESGI